MTRGKHNAHHLLFGNKLPHQQLEQIVDVTGDVFTTEFRDGVLSILYDIGDIEKVYNTSCINDVNKMVEIILYGDNK